MTITFRPMALADLPMVREWLLRPHVRRWWDDGSHPSYPEGDIEERRKAVTGEDPTRHFVIELDGRPIGDIQDYRTDIDPEYLAQIDVAEPAIGVDLYIAEPDLIGRGLGPRILRAFLRDVSFPHYGVDLVLIGPTRSNSSAIRAYEKAGFRYLKMYDEEGSTEKEHYLMEQRRADLEEAKR